MSGEKTRPRLIFADAQGNIFDHPHLLMLGRQGNTLALPRPAEVMPLPESSDLFLLPGRHAMGLDPDTGKVEVLEELAVAAFVAPAHTATSLSAFQTGQDAPCLPLFSYTAAGFANGRFYVAAKRTDPDTRQEFSHVPQSAIDRGARQWLNAFPHNRLVKHLAHCALTYCCPAAKNLALGRFEAPLPTSRACNAACVGCISLQTAEAGFTPPQERIDFTPSPQEIVEVMQRHAEREGRPVFSFGQGCEGEPLTEAALIAEAVALYRAQGGKGTVNVNTNGSLPAAVEPLAKAGVDSVRVSMVSARPELYTAYHRPKSFTYEDVRAFLAQAREHGLFISLNFLYFPGIGDCEDEIEALSELIIEHHVDFIQLRNLNIDPELFLELCKDIPMGPSAGQLNLRKRLAKARPGLKFGYFNPYLADRDA